MKQLHQQRSAGKAAQLPTIGLFDLAESDQPSATQGAAGAAQSTASASTALLPPPPEALPELPIDPDREDRVRASAALRAAITKPSSAFRICDDGTALAGLGLSAQACRQARIEANFAALALLQELDRANRPLTDIDRRTLARYSSWGGLVEVFIHNSPYRRRLAELVGEESITVQGAGVLNAHFTPPVAVRFMYDALSHLGVRGGRVLETSCGVGVFLGLTPADWAVKWTAIDIDRVNARIAALLYPDARVLCSPFEQTELSDNHFDLIVGNVPFENTKVFDVETPDVSLSVHNAFIARGLRKLRPGGTLAVLTSTYTLDGTVGAARDLFHRSADLVGAFRLPTCMFEVSANTTVSVDLLILRKRSAGDIHGGDEWLQTTAEFSGRTPIVVNAYMAKRFTTTFIGVPRDMQLGPYGGHRKVAFLANPSHFPEMAAAAVASLPAGACKPLAQMPVKAPEPERRAPEGTQPGTYFLQDASIRYAVSANESEPVKVEGAAASRLAAMIRLRERLRALIELQSSLGDSVADEEHLDHERAKLQALYRQFVQAHGALHVPANRRAFANDRYAALLLALEDWDDEAKAATPTALLTQRTAGARPAALTAANVKDALAICLGATGRVDPHLIGALLCKPIERVHAELYADGLAFEDPQSGRWEVAGLYLSGDIAEKLSAAEAAASDHVRFEPNVRALRAAMPPRVPASDIWITPGCPLVRPEDLVSFIDHLRNRTDGRVTARVRRSIGLRRWNIESIYDAGTDTTRWGLPEKPLCELLEDVCNNATPTVYRREHNQQGVEIKVVDPERSMAARSKAVDLREAFAQWILADEQRRRRVEDEYNRRFNTVKPAVYDGSHLTLPGLNTRITPGQHQKDAIWRGLIGSTGVFHVVGAGKTLIACAIAMEARRLGLRRKSALVVPNHLVGKTATEFQSYYPNANLLVLDRDDFIGRRRRVMLARIATGDFDCVIMAHSTFFKIRPDEETAKEVVGEITSSIELALHQAPDRRTVRQLQASLRRHRATYERFTGRSGKKQDDHLDFKSLGIDSLLVDEAQAFKNLSFATARTRVAGLSTAASLRATDMFIKVRAVQRLNAGGAGVCFLTGTPIANTMAEMFHVLRYLNMPMLRRRGIAEFDDWANLFGEVVAAIEVTPEGAGFRVNERFARFRNLPELMAMFATVSDVRTREDLNLPTPQLAGGQPQVVAVPASDRLKEYVASLVERARRIRSPDPEERPDPRVDNMLKVVTDGRKAALDLRLAEPGAAEQPQSKIDVAAQNIARIYHATTEQRSTQLVFCDLGTPGTEGFNVYEALRAKLIDAGVKGTEVAFIHDAATETKRIALYASVNRGSTRVVIGSTEKMGTGANMQRRLIANHDLDAPWRPDQVEQRAGRILRPGNTNPEVTLFRYVTEGTFDAYSWQLLHSKARFIAQVLSGKCALRSAEDIEARVMSYAEIKAAATGNPLIIELAKLQAEAQQLRSMKRAHESTALRARQQMASAAAARERHAAILRDIAADRPAWRPTVGEDFHLELLGHQYRPGEQLHAGRALLDAIEPTRHLKRQQVRLGRFAGFDLLALVGPFQPAVWLEGHGQYEVDLWRVTADALVGRLRKAVDFDFLQAQSQVRLQNAETNAKGAEETLAEGFSGASRLAQVEARMAEVERDLGISEDSSGGRAASPNEDGDSDASADADEESAVD